MPAFWLGLVNEWWHGMPKHADRPMKWTEEQEQALKLAFEGRWTQGEIATKCGVSPRTIWGWLKHPEFQARLETLRSDFAASIRDVAYADKARRIIALDAMAESARREFERRPLLVERRPTGRDPDSGEMLLLEQEAFNRDAHAAFRGALDDIAKELGQRTSKMDASAQIALIAMPSDVIDAL